MLGFAAQDVFVTNFQLRSYYTKAAICSTLVNEGSSVSKTLFMKKQATGSTGP